MFSDHISSIMIDPAFCGADEVVGGDYIRQRYTSQNRFQAYGFLIGDGLQNVQNPYGDVWKNDEFYAILRYCNIFFENIHRTYNLTPEEKRLWTGEMEALKAHVYFELLRRYGPFILVPENLPANSDMEVMQQPRAPIDSCVSAIVRLCDDAMDKLPPLAEKGNLRKAFHAKEAAATIKAMALLYAASPLFNGNSYMTNFVNKDGVKLFPESPARRSSCRSPVPFGNARYSSTSCPCQWAARDPCRTFPPSSAREKCIHQCMHGNTRPYFLP